MKRVLPEWLANPSVVSCNLKDDTAPVEKFGLDEDIVKILHKNFIPYFFPGKCCCECTMNVKVLEVDFMRIFVHSSATSNTKNIGGAQSEIV